MPTNYEQAMAEADATLTPAERALAAAIDADFAEEFTDLGDRKPRRYRTGLTEDQVWAISINYEESLDARGFKAFEKEVASTAAGSFLCGRELADNEWPADVVASISSNFGWRFPADADTSHDVALAFRVIDLALHGLQVGC